MHTEPTNATDTPQADTDGMSAVRKLLAGMGASVDEPEEPQDDSKNPIHALNLDSYGEGEVVTVDASAPDDLLDRTDDQLRRTAGPPFDDGKEGPFHAKDDPWSRDIPMLGRVSVDDEEQDSFWRALFHDTVWQTVVAIEKDGFEPRRYTFRTRDQGVKELVALAVDKVVARHPIKTIENTKLADDYYLRLCLITQLLAIDGVSTNAPNPVLNEGELVENSEWADKLASMARTWFNGWSESKIKMAFRAFAAFEVKVKILEDASINRTF